MTEHTTTTTTTAPSGRPAPLDFKGHPISYIMLDGVPWFSRDDLTTAMGWNEYAHSVLSRYDFPSHAKRDVEELTDEGRQSTTYLSPVGVWVYGHLNDPARTQTLAAWAKREAMRLCPDPHPGDPAMFLTLRVDGELPPRPFKFSGWRSAWYDLRDTGAHIEARALLRRGFSWSPDWARTPEEAR